MDNDSPLQDWERELLGDTKVVGFGLLITLSMAVNGLLNIVERFGADHIGNVPYCIYARSENGVLSPSCIIGVFFHDLGILRALLQVPGDGFCATGQKGGEGIKNHGGIGSNELREYLASQFGITLEDAAWDFLFNSQLAQDGGAPWGPAVEQACARLLERRKVIDPFTAAEKVQRALAS